MSKSQPQYEPTEYDSSPTFESSQESQQSFGSPESSLESLDLDALGKPVSNANLGKSEEAVSPSDILGEFESPGSLKQSLSKSEAPKLESPQQPSPKLESPQQPSPKQEEPKQEQTEKRTKSEEQKDFVEITPIPKMSGPRPLQEKSDSPPERKSPKRKSPKRKSPKKKKPRVRKLKGKRVPLKKSFTKTCDDLIDDLEGIVDKLTIEEDKYNEILRCVSNRNRGNINEKYDFLYPLLDDPNFNKKIALKKEFNDAKYIQRSNEDYEKIIEIADGECDINREFELSPHQKFVRNFLSFKTPYNSLLLFHGLGTGKTCSAISVCEEMRLYSKQLKNTKRIIIVASPNVQENFKLQLFDERKLKNIDGNWNIKSCTGNSFIKEINPMNMKGLSRDKVIRQIKRIISNSYVFLGYIQFANWLTKIISIHLRDDLKTEEKRVRGMKRINREFSNRMIVIDEVQNIRNIEDSALKKTSENLIKLVKYTDDMKLLLLSATPMFNSPKEIVWLLNLMNINDDRYSIKEGEIFDSDGNLRVNSEGINVGKELLIRKSTGYVSYVRGDNPFTFPYRLFPNDFGSPHSIKTLMTEGTGDWYPKKQINNTPIIEPITILDLFIQRLGSYQENVYSFMIKLLKKKYGILNNPKKGIQYTVLDPPIQILNFAYPILEEEKTWSMKSLKNMYGKKGLNEVFHKTKDKKNFVYKPKILERFGRIFTQDELPKFSGKISKICQTIKRSKGIVLIYSQFLDGGCVPIALALEEMGFKRYGKNKSLFKQNDENYVEPLDALTMLPKEEKGKFNQANYIMITGDVKLSPDNNLELIACTNENNVNGEIVKVIIVSKAGSEGLDFKNIRQVHILEPWYNINRIEQTIGRAVRNLSHCALPFMERNVEIYLYGSELKDNTVEAVDLYMYRLAERKAKKIGIVSRILKENAIDCLLNKSYNKINTDKKIQLITSSEQTVDYKLKDKIYSSLCDFMDNCDCNCLPDDIDIDEAKIRTETYDETFIIMNIDKIFHRIKMLFKEKYVYHKTELIAGIIAIKFYPEEQIYMALTQLIEDNNEFITDMLGRIGRLIVIGDYYMFQPLEIENQHISLFERSVPIDYKRKFLEFSLPETIKSIEDLSPLSRKDFSAEKKASVKSVMSKLPDEKYQRRLEDLTKKFNIISGIPKLLDSTNRKIWEYNCAWTLYNLELFNNELDRNILIEKVFDHFLDILPFNHKVQIINGIYFKDNLNIIEILMKKYFDKFIISSDGIESMVLFDNSRDITIFLFKVNNYWIEDPSKLTEEIKLKTIRRFKYTVELGEKQWDIGALNENIGFMKASKRYNIIFKTKSMKLSSNKRIKKGTSCPSGQSKYDLINKINSLIGTKNNNIKYKIGTRGGKKNSITEIYEYSDNDIKFYQLDDAKNKLKSRKPISINILQLCIELELLFRYFNKTRKNGKIWFLNELESQLNKIEIVGI